MIYFFRSPADTRQPIRAPNKNPPSKGIRCLATRCGKAGAWDVLKTI